MARVKDFTKPRREPLTMILPWGEYTVRGGSRSVLRRLRDLSKQVEDAEDDESFDAAAHEAIEVLDILLDGEGFREGAIAAWESDSIELADLNDICEACTDELGGNPGEV